MSAEQNFCSHAECFSSLSAVRFCSPPSSTTNCHSIFPSLRVSPVTSIKNSVWLALHPSGRPTVRCRARLSLTTGLWHICATDHRFLMRSCLQLRLWNDILCCLSAVSCIVNSVHSIFIDWCEFTAAAWYLYAKIHFLKTENLNLIYSTFHFKSLG